MNHFFLSFLDQNETFPKLNRYQPEALKKYTSNLSLHSRERAYFDSADWVLGKVHVLQKLYIICSLDKLDMLSTKCLR
jgi:hypothetical protein